MNFNNRITNSDKFYVLLSHSPGLYTKSQPTSLTSCITSIHLKPLQNPVIENYLKKTVIDHEF